jgi:hypothetical protein
MIIQADDLKLYLNPTIILNEKATLCVRDNELVVQVKSRTAKNARRMIRARDLIIVKQFEEAYFDEKLKPCVSLSVALRKPIPIPLDHEGVIDALSPEQFNNSILWSYCFDVDYLKSFIEKPIRRHEPLIAMVLGCKTWEINNKDISKVIRKIKKAISMNKDNKPEIRIFRS